MKTNKKKIALLGGAGFIGHNLALQLTEEGHEVSIIDAFHVNNFLSYLSVDHPGDHQDHSLCMLSERVRLLRERDISIYTQDARDYHKLSQLFSKIDPEVVVVLAAVSNANSSNKDPYSTFDHSFRTLENTLDAVRVAKPHVVFFSSSMVYGNFDESVVTEESNCNPVGIYGALKLSGEHIIKAYHNVFGLPYTIVRPSALYGERCVSRRVAQIFIENALNGKELVLNGGGASRLDFTYIGDLVAGICKVIENERSKNQLFNMTYGESRSLEELVNIVSSYVPEVKVRYEEKDRLVPERGTLSVEKARNLIGYNPQFPLEKGIEEYVKWYRKFKKQKNPNILSNS